MKRTLLLVLSILYTSIIYAKVKLPALIDDGMVLQRDQPVKIWGWADVEEEITVKFNKQQYQVTTAVDGTWSLTLPKLDAGGPYVMTIEGENEITIRDILVGDVWLCSGQSNMAFKMDRVKEKYTKEIAASSNNFIRQFLVKPSWNFSLQNDVQSEGWKSANPQNVLDFSAVAYFFAKAVYDDTRVPIGIINASYSATVAEAWISEEGLKHFPDFVAEANKFKDPNVVKQTQDADDVLKSNWYKLSREEDIGYSDNVTNWANPMLDISNWEVTDVPGYWDKAGIKNMPGVVWMVKEIDVPAHLAGRDATLFFGAIDDRDSTYFNGVKVGHSYMRGRERNYNVPGKLVKAGKNRIVVRILNPDGPGGFYPDKECVFISVNERIDLAGKWKYKVGAKLSALRSNMTTKFNIKPTAIYNSMIYPLTNYSIKGVVWYQGEGNAGRAYQYRQLFADLIVDWRSKWEQGDFPFLYVQLANYGKEEDQPVESSWAELREAQSMALALPHTGMAVIHDVGETNDIHPQDKKTVGDRLALAAMKVSYGHQIIASGPVYDSSRVEGNKIIIRFKNTGAGLKAKGDAELTYFTIAGADKKFVWAKAKIENNTVVVWADEIKCPVAVRYAWSNNPLDANLYNEDGLPASSFRTDNWEGRTFKK
ncbi:sialate O-acetylesterase [Sphingobacterium sp. SGR-19]|uniref:sialate O-acetylesterase n=1 Tax=Sphingobacterium sp. SGR-19 TaxID=2710886 RepID=UPI0013EA1AAA|nr:sialate O-acetylesterase [Sphingobacterium sp. SGR-19]NGM64320.1 sialate O-acetylesterase [Sphingobacterium sp. SGR-19]